MGRRVCPVCEASLEGRRKHARYGSGACRAEASRLRRILAGQRVDGFASVPYRLQHRRKPAGGVRDRVLFEP